MFIRSQEPVRASLEEYGRGIAGGLMFSLPLLYTMEVWWAGFLLDSRRMLICVVATFLLLLAYNRYGGIRPGVRLLDVVIDSVEEFGIGIVVAALVLFLLGRITPDMPHQEILGKIILESMLVSIGVSVGTAQLGVPQKESEGDLEEEPDDLSRREGESGKADALEISREPRGRDAAAPEDETDRGDNGPEPLTVRPHIRKQAALSLCGAVLFAANIAPTEEIVVIANDSPPWRLLALVAVSLALGALVLFFSGFRQARQMYPPKGLLVGTMEIAFSYAIALLASAMVLWFFRRFEGVSPEVAIAEVVVLGFVANLGASAGRLLIE